MPKHRVWVLVLRLSLIAAGLAVCLATNGCGGGAVVDDPPPQDRGEEPPRLGDHIDISLADLLGKPRAELAQMADDLLDKARLWQKAHRETKEVLLLLPELRLPLVVPVLREAKYSGRAGLSLPPYLAVGSTDSALALHLARHGDVEAARRLADPGDAETRRQIDACAGGRNYPVEWTRLVGLLLHAAESRLATGDRDGAAELIQLHRQLREVLDAKAAAGALGRVLLPRGREVLAMAATAWQAQNQEVLAEQAKQALASWGDLPAPSLPVPLGAARTEVSRLLGADAAGRVVPVPSAARALDLLALPFPDDNLDGVFAFFDPAGRFSQILVVYRARTGEYYPRPAELALLLRERLPEEAGNVGDGEAGRSENAGSHGLRRHVYHVGDLACDVTVVSRNNAVGGLVRCLAPGAVDSPPALPRDLGAVHLDRTFEQNRLRVTPEQRAEDVRSDRPEALAGIANPLAGLKVTEATLQRAAEQDLLSRLTLRYALEESVPLPKVALPLWSAWGSASYEGVDDDHGGHLAFRWEDARTRYTLRLPHETGAPLELEVVNRYTPEDLPARAAAAVAFDRAQRQARFAAGKLLTRLPRGLEVETVRLGMSRAEVEPLLPGGKSVLTRTTPDGLVLTFPGEPSRGAAYVARQLVLRFDGAGRLAEVRARYQDTSATAPRRGLNSLLASLKKRGGAPAEGPAPWAQLWPDLPARKPAAVCYRWQDDATLLTYQADSGGAEVAVRDCPADQEAGVALPPFEYLPRGPERCSLGDTRDALLSRWGVTQPAVAGTAVVLAPTPPSPYDALLVWFDRGQVSRIVARHARGTTGPTEPAQLAEAVQAAWVRDLRSLGWPRRRDGNADDVLVGFGWHDERTRVRLFWQEPDQGPPRLYTEWNALP
jgi:hypothetical protein